MRTGPVLGTFSEPVQRNRNISLVNTQQLHQQKEYQRREARLR